MTTNLVTQPLPDDVRKMLSEKADKFVQSHSSYWLGKSAEGMLTKFREGSIEYLDQLRSIQRSISSFVKIMTGTDIPVEYSSGQLSYTDGTSIVISADADPSKLDSTVGLALHEASHCLLSWKWMSFLHYMRSNFEAWVKDTTIPVDCARLGMQVHRLNDFAGPEQTVDDDKKDTAYDLVRMVMNVIEDRRVDLWVYQNAPGYQPYYLALYDRYFYHPDINKALQSPEARVPAVENYALHILNVTNKHFDVTALPGLKEIRSYIGLTEARLTARGNSDPKWKEHYTDTMSLDMLPQLFVDAVRIVELVLKHSEQYEAPKSADDDGDKKEGAGQPSDLPNMDGGRIRNVLTRLKKFLDHDVDKKQLSNADARMLQHIIETDASLHDVSVIHQGDNVKARVVLYRNVTPAIAQSPEFPFNYLGYKNNETVARGIRMGQALSTRIAVMQDETPLTFTRQHSGRLDKRLLSGLGFGQESVFSHTFIEQRKPVDVWIDVDLSSSMSGEKYSNAMAVAIAIAYAASVTRTLNCTIAVRSGYELPNVAILYDSTRHSVLQLKSVMPHISAHGGTPEGLCFEVVKNEILAKPKTNRRFFINLSDGEPTFHFTYQGRSCAYGGAPAWEHTRKLMDSFRREGITVLSYFIGGKGSIVSEGFRHMYGKDAVFIDPTQVNQIIKTLNKTLLG